MIRVRIAGPRPLLDRTLVVLQDLGLLHVDRPHVSDHGASDRAVIRERRHVERCLSDVETALERLHVHVGPPAPASTHDSGKGTGSLPEPPLSPAAVRRARCVRRRAEAIALATSALEDERRLLWRCREFFDAFQGLLGHELRWPDGQAFYVVLKAGTGDALSELRRRLDDALDGEIELVHRELPTGEWAVLILASARVASKVSALLSAARVEELPVPAGIGEKNLLRSLPAITARLAEIQQAMHGVDAERQALAHREGPWLCHVRPLLRDELLRLDARARVFAAEYLFVIEGWLPGSRLADLQQRVQATLGPEIVVSVAGAQDWIGDGAPVALHNPPLFQPFEVLTRMLPLPKYGTIDPTPFVAVFFPAFFGLMVGDVGYGLLLAGLAALLRLKSEPDTPLRSVSTVALACSSSVIVFGVLFGELFGSLGHLIGLRPFFNREEATIPFLTLALALGSVHVVLGLLLGGVCAWRCGHRREAVGRTAALSMVILTALCLLAAFEVLPAELFTPFVVAILVAFTVLVALEGVVAVIELLSTFGHVLSYARIMAIGTASLMLAVVANEMVGAMGSVLVGVVFALLFHLVNFAIALFSPTIHALRLHYVEFFGHFFSPGGAEYRPLGHWHPSA
jgi:V/A-type H+-transporting ATPase subunit I